MLVRQFDESLSGTKDEGIIYQSRTITMDSDDGVDGGDLMELGDIWTLAGDPWAEAMREAVDARERDGIDAPIEIITSFDRGKPVIQLRWPQRNTR